MRLNLAGWQIVLEILLKNEMTAHSSARLLPSRHTLKVSFLHLPAFTVPPPSTSSCTHRCWAVLSPRIHKHLIWHPPNMQWRPNEGQNGFCTLWRDSTPPDSKTGLARCHVQFFSIPPVSLNLSLSSILDNKWHDIQSAYFYIPTMCECACVCLHALCVHTL